MKIGKIIQKGRLSIRTVDDSKENVYNKRSKKDDDIESFGPILIMV